MLTPSTLTWLWPEMILVLVAVLTIVGGVFWPSRTAWSFLATVGVLLATLVAGLGPLGLGFKFNGPAESHPPMLIDAMGMTFRWVTLLAGFLFILMGSRRASEQRSGDSPGLILILIAGLSLVGWVGNGILLFLALEMISIPTYALLFTGRADRGSAEATLKYFLLSVLSSSLFLMGLAMLYGMTGSLDFTFIREQLPGVEASFPRTLLVSYMLLFCGLGFKLAALPFHFYAPDVYQGTTNANAGLLAVAPKIAGFIALVRILELGYGTTPAVGWRLMLLISMATMTLGNFSALWQRNVRRILAYSSIAHAGYLLMGVCVAMAASEMRGEHHFSGISASLLYLVVYVAASLGIFSVLAEVSGGPSREVSSLEDLHGLSRQRPRMAGALAVCLFSLSGIPPFAGFWGKLGLFAATLNTSQAVASASTSKWFMVLAIVGVINAATAAAYYLRIIAAVYFFSDKENVTLSRFPPGASSFAAITSAAIVIVVGILPGPLWTHFERMKMKSPGVDAQGATGVQSAGVQSTVAQSTTMQSAIPD